MTTALFCSRPTTNAPLMSLDIPDRNASPLSPSLHRKIRLSPKKLERIQMTYYKEVSIVLPVEKSRLENVISDVLLNCGASVMGFASNMGKYWFKIYDKANKRVMIHADIFLFEHANLDDTNETEVILSPVICENPKQFQTFLKDWREYIHVYTHSDFAKGMVSIK